MIYLATVTDQYSHPDYDKVLQRVRERFPGEVIFEPAKQGWSLKQWQAEWPGLLADITTLIIWPRPDFTIGRGVFTEYTDCQGRSVPIAVALSPCWWPKHFAIDRLPGDSYRHWARIRLTGKSKPKKPKKRPVKSSKGLLKAAVQRQASPARVGSAQSRDPISAELLQQAQEVAHRFATRPVQQDNET